LSAVDSNIIIACATVIAALLGLIGILLGRILGNTKRTVDHVANSHVDEYGNPINLRDDLDEKFEGLANLIRVLRADAIRDRANANAAYKLAAEAYGIAREALDSPKPHYPTQGDTNV
jgi:hypothetical protein